MTKLILEKSGRMSSLLIHVTLVGQYGVPARQLGAVLLVGGITVPPSLCSQGTEQYLLPSGSKSTRIAKMMIRSSIVADGTWTRSLNTMLGSHGA